MVVFTFGKVAYLPITKNASTTFTNHFVKMGWQENQLDQLDDTYEVFGHFRDPIDRHFKGTAEYLYKHQIMHLADDPKWQKVWSTAVMDLHSYPITWAVGNRKIHWIPIGPHIDTTELTRKWLRARGITLGDVVWANESKPVLKKLYNKLKTIEASQKEQTLCYFYDADIVLWVSLFPYVDEENIRHTCWPT